MNSKENSREALKTYFIASFLIARFYCAEDKEALYIVSTLGTKDFNK